MSLRSLDRQHTQHSNSEAIILPYNCNSLQFVLLRCIIIQQADCKSFSAKNEFPRCLIRTLQVLLTAGRKRGRMFSFSGKLAKCDSGYRSPRRLRIFPKTSADIPQNFKFHALNRVFRNLAALYNSYSECVSKRFTVG